MKKSKNFAPFSLSRFASSLMLLVISAVLFIQFESCNPTENRSLVTGSCSFTDLVINFDQNPMTIMAGETDFQQVQVAAVSNCQDYVDEIGIDIVGGPEDPEFSLTGCTDDDCSNNRGACHIVVGVPAGSTPGTYTVDLSITAFGGNNHATQSTESASFEVIVESDRDFAVDVPATMGVAQTYSFTVAANIVRAGGHNNDVNLSLEHLPLNVTYSFDPNPVPGNSSSSQMTITASHNTVPVDYSLEIKAHDGNTEKHDIFTLFLIEPFYLSLSEESIEIQQGQSASLDLYLNRMGGHTSSVQLLAEGDVVGQGEGFVEVSIDPNPTEGHSCDITLLVGNDVEPGTYTITFEGAIDPLYKYVTLELTVVE